MRICSEISARCPWAGFVLMQSSAPGWFPMVLVCWQPCSPCSLMTVPLHSPAEVFGSLGLSLRGSLFSPWSFVPVEELALNARLAKEGFSLLVLSSPFLEAFHSPAKAEVLCLPSFANPSICPAGHVPSQSFHYFFISSLSIYPHLLFLWLC